MKKIYIYKLSIRIYKKEYENTENTENNNKWLE